MGKNKKTGNLKAASGKRGKAGNKSASSQAITGSKTNAPASDVKTGWKTATIIIELRSDLCVSSGYSYAGIIDSDICYDTFGLPFIPARRIKGCMRECAETEIYAVLDHDSEEIFGKSDADEFGAIILGDARLKNADILEEEIRNLDKKYLGYLTRQKVLSYYTDVKGQTRIVNGLADENTLRYTRIHLMDVAPVFVMPVLYREDYYKDVKNIVSSLRHIGLNRNRGLGSVRCVLKDSETQKKKKLDLPKEDDGKRSEIKYILRNTAPLMMSNMEDNVSETRIRGQSIIGILANRYLAYPGTSADDQAFKDLFLNGKTIFSDAVPGKKGLAYYPVPLYINKLKKSSVLVNIMYSPDEINPGDQASAKYRTGDGNVPKKLSGYYFEDKGVADFLEVQMSLNHHHRHAHASNNNEEQLYQLEAISEGQEFVGYVNCSSKYVKLIETLFRTDRRKIGNQYQNILSFGKSKSIQYGTCVLDKCESKEILKEDDLKVFEGDWIKVDFLSDAVIADRSYNFSVDPIVVANEVKACIMKSGNSNNNVVKLETAAYEAEKYGDVISEERRHNGYRSILSTGEVAGYSGIWKMRKHPVPVIQAGSVLVFRAGSDCMLPDRLLVGEKRHEGFGLVRISKMAASGFAVNTVAIEQERQDSENASKAASTSHAKKPDAVKDIVKSSMEKEALECVKLAAYSSEKMKVSSSTIGRVSLMYKESILDGQDEDETFEGFAKRVKSIKTNYVKQELYSALFSNIASCSEQNEDWTLDTNMIIELMKGQRDTGGDVSILLKSYEDIFGKEAKESMVKGLWRSYVETYLVHQKYIMKEQESEGGDEGDS